jgi:hypothetical protein
VVNGGVIDGDVLLGTGNDLYQGMGSGMVTGVIHGGGDNDTFIADSARETFFGDAGADTFVYNAVAFSPSTANHDTIGDFISGNGDRIDVHGIDANVTVTATSTLSSSAPKPSPTIMRITLASLACCGSIRTRTRWRGTSTPTSTPLSF